MFRIRTAALFIVFFLLTGPRAHAKNPIRTDFFNHYPSAQGSVLEQLPTNSKHCGVCHFDFNGGGARNHYGAQVEYWRAQGQSNDQAFDTIALLDLDFDGYDNLTEITDTVTFPNTPTFPGLAAADLGAISNIPIGDVSPYVTPTSTVDSTPPSVTVLSPNGGEIFDSNVTIALSWIATDPSGVTAVDIYHSDDDGVTWKTVATGETNDGSMDFFVPHRPGALHRIRVAAVDGAGNPGEDDSDATFTVNPLPPGYVPTTLRDMDLPGTQPLEGPVFADADANCALCHGNYDTDHEMWFNWRGSMMGQAARDPLFFACLAVAEQDAPSVGDLCLRCHTPRGWLGGRSIDTSGNSLEAEDRQGVSCDFCHKLVDWHYVEGVSPAADADLIAGLTEVPQQYGNGQYVVDTGAPKRGPYADALDTGHPILESPFHRESALCGTCHDVSSPVYDKVTDVDYTPNTFDAPHPTMDQFQMGPIERTYSEWNASDFANGGVSLPQYGGVVESCQDCHMRNVTAAGSNDPSSPIRSDLPLHDMTGGNTVLQDIIPDFFGAEVDLAQLAASKVRAETTLTRAARLELTPDVAGVTVRVYNDTGHKLPTGYPEGRRMWLNVVAKDELDQVVYTSGDYDFGTGLLTHDEDAKIYQIKPGLSPALASAIGLSAGPSFHFVLNDSIYVDNRIPPRGFTNAAFSSLQMPPVAHSYADGQYWDDTHYDLPNTAATVEARLYYQTVSKEYVEFLRDENTTTGDGQAFYDSWSSHGHGAPAMMAIASTDVDVLTGIDDNRDRLSYSLGRLAPNPFQGRSSFQYALPQPGLVQLEVYDVRGRRVRTLENEIKPSGVYTQHWDGRDDSGGALASGVYFLRYRSGAYSASERVVLVR